MIKGIQFWYQLCTILLLTSCSNASSKKETIPFEIKGDTIKIIDQQFIKQSLKLGKPDIRPYSKEVISSGSVQPIPTEFAYIAPPFGGRVTKSYISLGESVQKGMPLFEIISPEFTAAQKHYFQAQTARDLAAKELQRKKDLFQNGVGAQRELEEALGILQITEKEFENTRAALMIYHVNPDETILGQPLIIRAPISGEIIENNIVTGQYIKNETEALAVVANLKNVWITAQVKEKDIRFIHEGDDIMIKISALPDYEIKGRVYQIDKSMDESTRSIRVLSICENKEKALLIGMYATVCFIDKPTPQIHIPATSLLQGEKCSYVLVQKEHQMFVKTPVEVELIKDDFAIIKQGLETSDIIVKEGGYYLK